ncbi:MAG: aryl-sulfate sulfotransferase [Ignavibacteria bacterium]|nr:aryl-sulfate sulfotransferase [Ignavibacteria bacterium]
MNSLQLILYIFSLLTFLIVLPTNHLYAQHTVGVTHIEKGHQDGYILFAPMVSKTTYLIDKKGRLINSWLSETLPGQSAYLLPDGSLLRASSDRKSTFKKSGNGGIIEKFNWQGERTWVYRISDTVQCQHHDVYPMPNGNILAIVYEIKQYDQALAAGRNPNFAPSIVFSEKIVEIKPEGDTGRIVWEWNSWDHIVQDVDPTKLNFGSILDHPELINLNYQANKVEVLGDWIYLNSVSYNAELDQIIVSSYDFDEIWILDHSTTTSEAASHSGGKSGKGGDILYRWGNPVTYNAGTKEDQMFFAQHAAHWIDKGKRDAGKIMVFNNGARGDGKNYSSVDVIAPPRDKQGNYLHETGKAYLPLRPDWQFVDTTDGTFFTSHMSNAERLPNGNTLICNGLLGEFFEVTPKNKIVWKYKNPVMMNGPIAQGTVLPGGSFMFRCSFYPTNYPAFKKRKLIPGETIEINP